MFKIVNDHVFLCVLLGLNVRFDHPSFDPRASLHFDYVDEKTVAFSTPPCPVQLTRNQPRFSIPIVVTLNDTELNRVPFTYLSCLF